MIVQKHIIRCRNCGNDPWGCLGCRACGVQDCRFDIGICSIIDKIIDIGRRIPQIICNFREFSVAKMAEELLKFNVIEKIT